MQKAVVEVGAAMEARVAMVAMEEREEMVVLVTMAKMVDKDKMEVSHCLFLTGSC